MKIQILAFKVFLQIGFLGSFLFFSAPSGIATAATTAAAPENEYNISACANLSSTKFLSQLQGASCEIIQQAVEAKAKIIEDKISRALEALGEIVTELKKYNKNCSENYSVNALQAELKILAEINDEVREIVTNEDLYKTCLNKARKATKRSAPYWRSKKFSQPAIVLLKSYSAVYRQGQSYKIAINNLLKPECGCDTGSATALVDVFGVGAEFYRLGQSARYRTISPKAFESAIKRAERQTSDFEKKSEKFQEACAAVGGENKSKDVASRIQMLTRQRDEEMKKVRCEIETIQRSCSSMGNNPLYAASMQTMYQNPACSGMMTMGSFDAHQCQALMQQMPGVIAKTQQRLGMYNANIRSEQQWGLYLLDFEKSFSEKQRQELRGTDQFYMASNTPFSYFSQNALSPSIFNQQQQVNPAYSNTALASMVQAQGGCIALNCNLSPHGMVNPYGTPPILFNTPVKVTPQNTFTPGYYQPVNTALPTIIRRA